MIYSMVYEPRVLRATEQRLDKLYEAAKNGLKGDSLAYAAGMTPLEFNQLKQMDPGVDQVIGKGYADAEMELSSIMMAEARAGDAKAALSILQHRHNWVATQQVKHEGGVNLTLMTGVPQQLSDPNDISYKLDE